MSDPLEAGLRINTIKQHFNLDPTTLSQLNRIYELIPQLKKFPENTEEINVIMKELREYISKEILVENSTKTQQTLPLLSNLCLLLSDLEKFLSD